MQAALQLIALTYVRSGNSGRRDITSNGRTNSTRRIFVEGLDRAGRLMSTQRHPLCKLDVLDYDMVPSRDWLELKVA
ncbi:hypothetical protein CQ10_40325 [Bradyrhizobium valentinum]|nr:hypothetical protein CQ10_40325 [Bradyrhizobium valentinum]